MYWTGLEPTTGEPVYVPRAHEEKKRQRKIIIAN
jgi:hypothetical protein